MLMAPIPKEMILRNVNHPFGDFLRLNRRIVMKLIKNEYWNG